MAKPTDNTDDSSLWNAPQNARFEALTSVAVEAPNSQRAEALRNAAREATRERAEAYKTPVTEETLRSSVP